MWNYASIDEFLLAIGGCITGIILSSLVAIILRLYFSYAVNILSGILVILSIIGFRIRFSNILDNKSNEYKLKRTLIIGAGEIALLVNKEMKKIEIYIDII